MTNFRTMQELSEDFDEITKLSHVSNEPIFITKNGVIDVVIMSHDYYEEQEALLELYEKLAEAEAEIRSNAEQIPAKQVFAEFRKMLEKK